MRQPYADRRERAQERLRERGADAAVAYPGPNLQYFTGFRGEPVDRFHVLYLPAEGDATLVTPDGYLTQARKNASADRFRTVAGNDPEAVATAVADLFGDGDRLLIDDDALYALTGSLHAAVGTESIQSAAPLFGLMRRRKEQSEVAALKRSAAVADEVSETVRALGTEAIGMTEAELATAIRRELHARGARGVAFDVVVGSGPNGADPALRFSDREICAGEPVVVDFGCFIDSYASDQTRTVVFDGTPPAPFEDVHDAVLDALDAGVAAAEPGATAADVDAAARSVLAERGYGEHFTHPTGHGVGLASHEPLSIAEGDTTTLEEGMVFSIEPGAYFEDKFGVRIEDLVVLTEDGCERLNDSPRTWKPL